MKVTNFLTALLLCMCSLTLSAQSTKDSHPITEESFELKIELTQKKSLKVVEFISAKGKKLTAQITSPGDVPLKTIAVGTIIVGEFRFNSFASDGGLGTTRAYKGKGVGVLKITKPKEASNGKNRMKLDAIKNLELKLL